MRIAQGKDDNAASSPRSPRNVNSIEPFATVDVGESQRDVAIAVMGATGTGKTTFVNAASGANFKIGNDLMSCTSVVAMTPPFPLDGRNVTLIDTPGFDDTHVSDVDILSQIALYLQVMYEEGYKLSGIIYLHRISDVRMGGIARKNFKMFRKLCGDKTLKNVIIATTHWAGVEMGVAEAREQQLATSKDLFQPALEKGARLVRLTDTSSEAAYSVLRNVLGLTPRPVLIQQEMVDQRRHITQTSAGQELISEGFARVRQLRSQFERLAIDIRAADEEGDEETREELEEDRRVLELQIASGRVDPDEMRVQYEEKVEGLTRKLRELREALKEEQIANSESQAARQEDFGDRERMRNMEAEMELLRSQARGADAERMQAERAQKAAEDKLKEYDRKLADLEQRRGFFYNLAEAFASLSWFPRRRTA